MIGIHLLFQILAKTALQLRLSSILGSEPIKLPLFNAVNSLAPCLRQLGWRWQSEAQLAALAKKVWLPRERRKVKLILHVGFSAEAAKPNVVLLGVLHSAANPTGLLCRYFLPRQEEAERG